MPILDKLKASNVRIILNLSNYEPGIYQVEPVAEVDIAELLVESILPAAIEVTISVPVTPTP